MSSSSEINYVEATQPFAATGTNQLSFGTGALLVVLQDVNEHWWFAADTNGKTGLVPKSYCRRFTPSSPSSSRRSSAQSSAHAPTPAARQEVVEENDFLTNSVPEPQSPGPVEDHHDDHDGLDDDHDDMQQTRDLVEEVGQLIQEKLELSSRLRELETVQSESARLKQENAQLRKRLQQAASASAASPGSTAVAGESPSRPPLSRAGSNTSVTKLQIDPSDETVIRLSTALEEQLLRNSDLENETQTLSQQLHLERSSSELLSQELKVFHLKHSSIVKQMAANRNSSHPAAELRERKEYHALAKEAESVILDSKVNAEVLAAFHLLNRARLFRDMLRANLDEVQYYLHALRKEGLTQPRLETTNIDLSKIDSPIMTRLAFITGIADGFHSCLLTAKDHEHEAVILYNKLHTGYIHRPNVREESSPVMNHASSNWHIGTAADVRLADVSDDTSVASSFRLSSGSFALPARGSFSSIMHGRSGSFSSIGSTANVSSVQENGSPSSRAGEKNLSSKRAWR